MATIKDVAKRANVSTTTVSHVINKTRFVAEETRNAVWAAIKELHYSPSAVARSLKVNHTKSIGLLATSSEAAYFAEIIESVEKSCFQKGYTLILGNAWNDPEKQRAYLSMMAQKRVDGLLVMCSEYPDSVLSMLEEYRHIPMVVMDWGEAKADFTDAVIDNAFQGGDIMAMGAICAADEMGLRVPQDISLIGYDNVRNARYFSPALTTIHQPKDSLGEAAFNMLLDRIVNKREESQSIEVHPRLVERRSVADGPFVDYRR